MIWNTVNIPKNFQSFLSILSMPCHWNQTIDFIKWKDIPPQVFIPIRDTLLKVNILKEWTFNFCNAIWRNRFSSLETIQSWCDKNDDIKIDIFLRIWDILNRLHQITQQNLNIHSFLTFFLRYFAMT